MALNLKSEVLTNKGNIENKSAMTIGSAVDPSVTDTEQLQRKLKTNYQLSIQKYM